MGKSQDHPKQGKEPGEKTDAEVANSQLKDKIRVDAPVKIVENPGSSDVMMTRMAIKDQTDSKIESSLCISRSVRFG
jgi:hypothetical protein